MQEDTPIREDFSKLVDLNNLTYEFTADQGVFAIYDSEDCLFCIKNNMELQEVADMLNQSKPRVFHRSLTRKDATARARNRWYVAWVRDRQRELGCWVVRSKTNAEVKTLLAQETGLPESKFITDMIAKW